MANGTIQLRMNEFLGINQSMGENSDMRYATWAENVDTRHGELRTGWGYKHYDDIPSDGHNGGIVKFSRYDLRHSDWIDQFLLVCCKTRMFAKANSPYWDQWQIVGDFNVADGQGNSIDTLMYEGASIKDPNTQADILIVSSQSNGIEFYMVGDGGLERHETNDTIKNLPKFGALARCNERIFGAASKEEPDRIYYSAPFDPMNWDLNLEIPEDGGGFIDYPTWDGDSFIALVPFGSDLLAFKHNSLCVISGTNPGEYTIYNTFGTEGPIAKNTICVYRNMVFFLTTRGIGMFDGQSIRTISRDAIYQISQNVNGANVEMASATIKDGIYMCSVCIYDDVPDAVIEYDIERNTYMLRTGLSVTAWYTTRDEFSPYSDDAKLHIAVSDNPYEIYECGNFGFYDGKPIHSVWESPFTDAGHKESIKSAFRVYAIPEDIDEGYDEEIDGPRKATVNFTIVTERKSKTKELKAQKYWLSKRKMLSKSISNSGRQFKWKIESDYYFRIQTGIQIQAELDSD